MNDNGRIETEDVARALRPLYADLRRFAAVVGGMHVEPDDLVQEALVRLLASGRWHSVDDVDAFLRRAIVDAASSEVRPSIGERAAFVLGPNEFVLVDDYPPDLVDIGGLDPMARALLCLVELDGVSTRQAATTLGCSEAAARARLTRARRRVTIELASETFVA
jgi:DNA-directed RNA polymerase specialized sigma24 family protein